MLHIRGRGDAMDMKEIMRRAMSEMARLRNKKLTPQQRREIASMGGKSSWADLTPEERSVEMKRRARIRKRNKAKAHKTPAPSSR
jgi:hypothetical protein